MMIVRKIGIGLALALVGSVASAAEQVVLQCDLPGQEQLNWVQPSIVVAYEPGAGKALVADKIIAHYNEKPIWAELRESEKRILLNWQILGAKDSWGNPVPSMHYVLEFRRENRAVSVRARPQGFANMHRGKGTCKELKSQAALEKFKRNKTRILDTQADDQKRSTFCDDMLQYGANAFGKC